MYALQVRQAYVAGKSPRASARVFPGYRPSGQQRDKPGNHGFRNGFVSKRLHSAKTTSNIVRTKYAFRLNEICFLFLRCGIMQKPSAYKKKRGTPCRACHAVFISLCYVLLSRADCSAGAHVCASTAVNAYIGVDRVFFAFADCSAGAFVDACSACNAVIADYISHSDVRFNCLMMFQIFPCKITALFETCKL